MKTKFNFDNPEDFKKLEKMAYDATIKIDDFPPAEYRYFDRLRILYARFKYDDLPKHSAEAEKKKLYSEYMEANSAYNHWCEVHKAYQDGIRKAELLMSNIEKTDDVAAIAAQACEIISILTGEETFAKMQKRKIKNVQKEGNNYES